jgi:signal transduction histidine kinase
VGRSVATVLHREESQVVRRTEHESAVLDGSPTMVEEKVVVITETHGDDEQPPRVRMIVDGRELSPEEIALQRARHADPLIELRPDAAGDSHMLWVSGEGFSRAIPLPRSGVDQALQRYTRQLGGGLLVLLGIGLLLSFWLAQRIARPLRDLADAAQAVGDGRLGVQAPAGGPPEVRQTVEAFNAMSARLKTLDAEATALRANRELAELGEIGRGLAHSLRNPLHALGLSLESLANQTSGSTRAAELAQSGREQLHRVDQALRGFLALSTGTGASAAPTALREVIDDVLLEASQRAQGRVKFLREGETPSVLAVPAELRVMLHALVINAFEASPDGATVRVTVGTMSDDAVCVDVVDQGEGSPEAIRVRLFQPHVSGKPHGAGMGLYLAERIARLRYAGSIALQPAQPRGTCARLLLHPRGANAHDR